MLTPSLRAGHHVDAALGHASCLVEDDGRLPERDGREAFGLDDDPKARASAALQFSAQQRPGVWRVKGSEEHAWS